jgi:hypothetical protein
MAEYEFVLRDNLPSRRIAVVMDAYDNDVSTTVPPWSKRLRFDDHEYEFLA